MLSTLFLIFFFVSLSRQQILSYQIHSILSILFFIFFKKVFLAFVTMQRINFHAYHPPTDKRRRRDLNPRAAINDLLPFQGSPFGQLGYFSKLIDLRLTISITENHRRCRLVVSKRRGWDSNPRALADKRFSRPPRYDHFDTSPYFNFFQLKIAVCISDFVILSKSPILVNRFFKIFSKFFRQRFLRLPDPPVW